MNARLDAAPLATPPWPRDMTSRVPSWVYTDPANYARELTRIFYGPHWCYVGLAAEIPNAGDFRRSFVGERSVIVVRAKDGTIHCVENHCAHRGAQFCQAACGNAKVFVCPYHQWGYGLDGALKGVPFCRGVKREGAIHGGMPEDFRFDEHGLTALRVHVHNGVVFASFDPNVPEFSAYLGAEILGWFKRVFDGRELRLLGYSQQRIAANWKLMQENIKDPYHPGLLHTWFVTFGLWRADQQSSMVMDATGRHAAMISRRNEGGAAEVTQGVASFREGMKLHDDRVLDVVPEPWWNGPTVVMTTIFPSLIVQQQVNSVSTRHIVPRGVGAFDFRWTHFGFADDTPEMTRRRLRQANLFGPAGYVSADDGEVLESQQQGFRQDDNFRTISELDGRAVRNTDHMVTETLIRGMYNYYRGVMGL